MFLAIIHKDGSLQEVKELKPPLVHPDHFKGMLDYVPLKYFEDFSQSKQEVSFCMQNLRVWDETYFNRELCDGRPSFET